MTETTTSYPATKIVCQLDEQGYFMGEAIADLSPMEAEQGVYLLPSGCIDQPLPAKREGFIAKWAGSGWEYIENHQGKTVYATADQSSLVMTEFGTIPMGYTLLQPHSQRETWDGESWSLSLETQETLFAEHQTHLISKIAEKTDRLKSAVLVGYPQAEIDSFYRQESEARAWVVDNNVATPMLSAIAENRGVSLAILAQKVIEKADLVSTIMGHIIGTRQGFEDRILTAKNLEELTACEQEIEQWQLPNP